MRCHTGAEWSLIHHDWCPYTKRKCEHTQREREPHGEMKTDGLMLLQAKEHTRWPVNHRKLGERPGTRFPSQPLEGTNPAQALNSDFELPEPGEKNLCGLSLPVNGTQLWRCWQTPAPLDGITKSIHSPHHSKYE